MNYSIIIPYRDRKSHLELLLPRLIQLFSNDTYEIIVAEQDDAEKFRLSSLYDVAFKHSRGDILVFHDVDYYPSDDVSYSIDIQPVYPVRRVFFVDADFKMLPDEQIPGGYRHFKYDVGNHWGGVFIMLRKHFELINGFNPLYIGWGKEEEETRLRMSNCELYPVRNDRGTFYALPHVDNAPPADDPDFIKNHVLLQNAANYSHIGYTNIDADVSEFKMDGFDTVRWLKIKNWRLT